MNTPTATTATASKLMEIAMTLTHQLKSLAFKGTVKNRVTHVYNPLEYAWEPHAAYINKYASASPKMMLIGMNPGPWGMSQNGVPFGEVNSVLEFLQIDKNLKIGKPEKAHLKRKVEGFECTKSEVSGKRLWGFMKRRFGTAEEMSKHVFVYNYCPLVFMCSSGANVVPEKLAEAEREVLFKVCDESLKRAVDAMKPEIVCGIGLFTGEICLRLFSNSSSSSSSSSSASSSSSVKIGMLQHPSPAGPGGKVWESAESFDDLILKPVKYFNKTTKKTSNAKKRKRDPEDGQELESAKGEEDHLEADSSPPEVQQHDDPATILLSEIEVILKGNRT
eukprot:TRINITY_DN6139_c0_g3_i2.p1 TRINITY_DN6139_c0_g3~~TRINITY_DN6139_c0_g3_i2.p1  ORF type:complete len:385 (+),score=118.45 TRINITY_DN6139_c0_g3_i2:154-1155(+)